MDFHVGQLVKTHDDSGKQRESVIASAHAAANDGSGRVGYLVCFGDYTTEDTGNGYGDPKPRYWRAEHKISRR